MAISASMVKELREKTGAGMMDCKKALTNTDGDMDKAVEWLRENGLAKAEKKAGRIAAEGIVKTFISADGKNASMVEVNSETDFVAKNDKFQDFVGDVVEQINGSAAEDVEAFLAEAWAKDSSKTVKEELASMVATIGENMNIRRFAKLSADNGVVVDYIHAPAVLCFFHKLVCLGKYHGLHGASLLRYHGHADRVIVTAKSPQAADPQILLGELGLFIALAEGLQTFQLVHQRLGYVL